MLVGAMAESLPRTSTDNRPTINRAPVQDETELLAALRAGDTDAFGRLVDRYHVGMIRFAQQYVPDRSMAESCVQEAWLQVLRGLDQVEVHPSLRAWIFSRVHACAQARDQPSGALSELTSGFDAPSEPTVDPSRFQGPNDRFPGGWRSFPPSWDAVPDQRLLAPETRQYLQDAIDTLPSKQREVVMLRDVQGCSEDEVCSVLRLSGADQRVLLHRGRARVRRMLEQYLTGD